MKRFDPVTASATEKEQHSDTVAYHTPSICLEMQGIRIEIHEQAGADVIRNTLLALRQLC